MARTTEKPTKSRPADGDAESGARKRRKVEAAAPHESVATEDAVNGVSKEERRLAKKARRAANRAEKAGNGVEPERASIQPPLNIEHAAPQTERQKGKRKHDKEDDPSSEAIDGKLEASHHTLPNSFPGTKPSKTEIPQDRDVDVAATQDKPEDKATAKSLRKAEKARKKRKTTSGDSGSKANGHEEKPVEPAVPQEVTIATPDESTNIPSRDPPIINNGPENAKAARKQEKEERKRLKAAKKAQAGTSSHPIPTTSSNGHSEVPTPTKPAPAPSTSYVEAASLTSRPQSDIDTFLADNFISINDPSSTSPLRPIIDFSYLPEAAASHSLFAGFKAPTPIQAAAWPFLLSSRDVVGVAETGSGKTLAFGVPCIRSIVNSMPSKQKSSSNARAVIVSPTRELAVQIHEQIEKLATPAHLSTACIYGGVPKDSQRLALQTAHIIVATPGRLNDLIEEGVADLSSVNYLVLDEADRMLDKGFEDAIRTIISHTPSTASGRQTLMFTATWPPSVRELAATFMSQPVHITIGDNNPTGELRANKSITQRVEVLEPEAKNARLLQIIKEHQGTAATKNDRILIFCLYKKEATRIESYLSSRNLRVAAIHGDLNQAKRQESLDAFKSGSCPLLVATDVAARGLDIPSVKLVLNLTFPLTVEDYVHRIGRTGRAGAQGLAITLFTVHEKAQSGALINVLRAAGQEVPEELLRFGGTVKKKVNETYGAWAKDLGDAPSKGTKIKF